MTEDIQIISQKIQRLERSRDNLRDGDSALIDLKSIFNTEIGDLKRIRANANYYLSRAIERASESKVSNPEETLPSELTSIQALNTIDTQTQYLKSFSPKDLKSSGSIDPWGTRNSKSN
jgi:hypothetical protein